MSDIWQNEADVLVIFNWDRNSNGDIQEGLGVSPLLVGCQLRIYCQLQQRPELFYRFEQEEWLPVTWEDTYYSFVQNTPGTYQLSLNASTVAAKVVVTTSETNAAIPPVQGLEAQILDNKSLAFVVKQPRDDNGEVRIIYYREEHNQIYAISHGSSVVQLDLTLGGDSTLMTAKGPYLNTGRHQWRAQYFEQAPSSGPDPEESGGGEVIIIDVEEGE